MPPALHTERMKERGSERETGIKDRLRDLSWRSKNPAMLNEIENQPAYQRKNVTLTETTPSSESIAPKYSLSEDNGTTEVKKNNTFLYDNVD